MAQRHLRMDKLSASPPDVPDDVSNPREAGFNLEFMFGGLTVSDFKSENDCVVERKNA